MAVKPKRKVRTEHEEQQVLMAWALVAEEMQSDPARRLALRWTHAIPNGFYRGFAARRKAKEEGVKAGILDVFVPSPELGRGIRSGRTKYFGLYIEMKRRGETLRSGQSEFMDYLDLVHYRNALCYTWQAAARIIVEHLDLKTYPPIDGEGEDDTEIAAKLLALAKEIDLRRNPPAPRKPKRTARPRKSKVKK